MSGGRPDYEIKIKHKDAKYATRVGAAWRTKDGAGINIRLDPGVSVSTPDGVFLTLWPAESKEEREARFNGGGQRGGATQREPRGGGYEPPPDDGGGGGFGADNIPFDRIRGEVL